MAAEPEAIIHVLISLAILLFAAKIFAEIFNKWKLPAVLGELIAGIIVGPFALGSIPIFDGKPLVILNETILQIGSNRWYCHIVHSRIAHYSQRVP